MKVNCCYRLIPDGEVIHSFFDTDTGLVEGLPVEFVDTRYLPVPEYSRSLYRGLNVQFDVMTESILLSNPSYALVLEVNGLAYRVLQWDGVWRTLKSATDDSDVFNIAAVPHPELYKPIGYRKTQLRQYRTCPGLYRLVASKYENVVYTQDGMLICDFDINTLSSLDYHYAGYKDAVNANYYAVVYQDDKPRFVELSSDNRLRIVI